MIRTSSEECKSLAISSLKFICNECKCNHATLFIEQPKVKAPIADVTQTVETKVVQKKKLVMDLSDD